MNFIERVFAYSTELGLKIDQDKIISDLSGQLPRLAKNAGGTALGFVSGFFFVSIFLIFLLVGRNPNVVKTGIYADIDQKVRKYIGTKVALSAITGILVWISLKFIGLELAGVFGMLAFFLNFIPNIGSIIATFLPIPVAVAQFDTVFPIVFVIMVPGVIQMTVGNVIEPKIMGSGLNLHPIAILLALSFWGLLWGIPGMFLAVPLTAIIRIIMSQFETLKPISDVLAGTLPGTNNSIQPDTLEA